MHRANHQQVIKNVMYSLVFSSLHFEPLFYQKNT